jgi:hypothetical protein
VCFQPSHLHPHCPAVARDPEEHCLVCVLQGTDCISTFTDLLWHNLWCFNDLQSCLAIWANINLLPCIVPSMQSFAKVVLQWFLPGTLWHVHLVWRIAPFSTYPHITCSRPRALGQIDNQCSHSRISTRTVVGVILSCPIWRRVSDSNSWVRFCVCPVSEPMHNHIPVSLSMQAEALTSAFAFK